MTRVLAAELPAALVQHLEHVAVTYLGAGERHGHFLQRVLEPEIGHLRADHAAAQNAARAPVPGNDVQQLIAVIELARRIRHDDAVAVAVEGDSEMRCAALHLGLQRFRMRRTDASLMLKPSGLAPIETTSAPSS